MRAFAPFLPPAKRIYDGAGGFSPSTLDPILWALDQSDNGSIYHDTQIDNKFVLRSRESAGTFRKPRKGRCHLYDGSNDTATFSTISYSGAFTVCFHFNRTDTSASYTFVGNSANNANLIFLLTATAVYVESSTGSSGSYAITAPAPGTWYHLAVTRDGSNNTKVYLNGVLIDTKTITGTFNFSRLGARGSAGGTNLFSGKMRDVRMYSVEKSASEITAIMNQEDTPTAIDTTSLSALWWCNGEAGTSEYDASGNGKSLTLAGPITEATFHAVDSAVPYNPANWVGHGLSGSQVIPRNEASTANDAAGSSLAYTGVCPYPVVVHTQAMTGDGTSVYAAVTQRTLTGDFEIEATVYFASTVANVGIIGHSQVASTSSVFINSATNIRVYIAGTSLSFTVASMSTGAWYTVKVVRSSGSVRVYVNGTESSTGALSDSGTFTYDQFLRYTNSTYGNGSIGPLHVIDGVSGVTTYYHFPGGGNDNSLRDIYWIASDDTYGKEVNAIKNGTVADIFAVTCPGHRKGLALLYGGRRGAKDEIIPAVPGGSICADGNSLAFAAGSAMGARLIDFDHWAAPELAGRSIPNGWEYGDDFGGVITPSNSAFGAADGKFVVFDAALTGADLANMQDYTS